MCNTYTNIFAATGHACIVGALYAMLRGKLRTEAIGWLSFGHAKRNAELAGAAEQILSEEFRAIDCLAFLAGKWINDRYGTLPAEFLSSEIDPSTGQPDVVHGSLEYYRQLVKEIFSRFSIKPHSIPIFKDRIIR